MYSKLGSKIVPKFLERDSKWGKRLQKCCLETSGRFWRSLGRPGGSTPDLRHVGFHFGYPGEVQRTNCALPETRLPTIWRPRRHQGTHRDPKAPKMVPQDSQKSPNMTSKPPTTKPRSAPDPKNGAIRLPKLMQNREN